MKVILLIWFLFAPAVQQDGGNIIHVTVIGENGRAMGGVRVVFEDDTGELAGECFTKPYTGLCDITLRDTPAGELIRGHLTVGSWGQRSVIWPGGELNVLADVEDLGFDDYPPQATEPGATTLPETAVPHPETTLEPVPEDATETPAAAGDEGTPSQTPTAEPQPIITQTEPSSLFSALRFLLSSVCVASIVAGMVVLLVLQNKKGRGG